MGGDGICVDGIPPMFRLLRCNCISRFKARLSHWGIILLAVSVLCLLSMLFYVYLVDSQVTNKRTGTAGNALRLARLVILPELQRKLLLLILTPSAPANLEQRNAIRKTWGCGASSNVSRNKFSEHHWKVIFLVGRKNGYVDSKVEAEARKNGDILIGELEDSYQNLVMKTLTGFSWAATVNCTYVLKADDDVYVHIPRLIKWLSNPQLPSQLYAGQVHSRAEPVRRTNSKYFINKETFSEDRYPPYCGGPFYVLSRNILGGMLDAARDFKPLHIEDAYMGILAKSLGVVPVHIREFKFYFPFGERDFDEFSVCDFATFIAVGHQMSATLIQDMHLKVKAVDALVMDAGCFWKTLYLALIISSIAWIFLLVVYSIFKIFI